MNEAMKKARDDFAKIIADKLLEEMKNPESKWRKGWKTGERIAPFNPTTNKYYAGSNMLNLSLQDRADPRWMTFQQAKSIGAQVKKGAKGSKIVHWKTTREVKDRDENGKPILDENGKAVMKTIKISPIVTVATVFNAEDIEGLPEYNPVTFEPDAVHERLTNIIRNTGVEIRHGGDRAFYKPYSDYIQMPRPEQFESKDTYLAVLSHELMHSTSHESRMNRDVSGTFGTPSYAREELRAEIGSYMLALQTGCAFDTSSNAGYLKSWIKVLEDDPVELIVASTEAHKMTKYIMSFENNPHLDSKNNIKTVIDLNNGDGRNFAEHVLDGRFPLDKNFNEMVAENDTRLSVIDNPNIAYQTIKNTLSEVKGIQTKLTYDEKRDIFKVDVLSNKEKEIGIAFYIDKDAVISTSKSILNENNNSVSISNGLNKTSYEATREYILNEMGAVSESRNKYKSLIQEELGNNFNKTPKEMNKIWGDFTNHDYSNNPVRGLFDAVSWTKEVNERFSGSIKPSVDIYKNEYVISFESESDRVKGLVERLDITITIDVKTEEILVAYDDKEERGKIGSFIVDSAKTYDKALDKALLASFAKDNKAIDYIESKLELAEIDEDKIAESMAELEDAFDYEYMNYGVLPEYSFKESKRFNGLEAVGNGANTDIGAYIGFSAKGGYTAVVANDLQPTGIEPILTSNSISSIHEHIAESLQNREKLVNEKANDLVNNHVLGLKKAEKEELISTLVDDFNAKGGRNSQLVGAFGAVNLAQDKGFKPELNLGENGNLKLTLDGVSPREIRIDFDRNGKDILYFNNEEIRQGHGLDRRSIDFNESLNKALEMKEKLDNRVVNIAQEDVWLNVPYEEKDQAMALGARFVSKENLRSSGIDPNATRGMYKCPKGTDLEPLKAWHIKEPNFSATSTMEEQLEVAFNDLGLEFPSDFQADGTWRRTSTLDGKANNKDGSYIIYKNENGGIPAGLICNHSKNSGSNPTTTKWIMHKAVNSVSPSELKAIQESMALAKKAEEAKRLAKYDKMAEISQLLWEKGEPVQNNKYSSSKKLATTDNLRIVPEKVSGKLHDLGLRVAVSSTQKDTMLKNAEKSGKEIVVVMAGDLIVPLKNEKNEIRSLQTINSNFKGFLKGGEVSGKFVTTDGKEPNKDFVIVAEGYATADTVHRITNKQVVVAFNAKNMEKVVDILKEQNPNLKVLLAGDNDHFKESNTGKITCQKIAEKHKDVAYVLPVFDEHDQRTDWNDYLSKSSGKIQDNLKLATEIFHSELNKIKSVDAILSTTNSADNDVILKPDSPQYDSQDQER